MADKWFAGLLISLLCVSALKAADSTCTDWTRIAQGLSGNGRLQICNNNKTKECTRFDCEGSLHIAGRHGGLFPIKPTVYDYCYGCQLNSCRKPITMDFYMTVPSHNFSFKESVTSNEMKTLSNLKFPLGNHIEATPVFVFNMDERDGVVAFSVKLKVQVSVYGTNVHLPYLEKTLIDDASIPTKTCPHLGAAPKPEPFEPGTCHKMKYPTSPRPAPVATTVKPQPSSTLNKKCDFIQNPCSRREICNSTSHLCECGPDFDLSPAKDACVSFSKVGQPCRVKADCGFNEDCQKTDGGIYTCQCKKGYQYLASREMCVVIPHHGNDKKSSTTEPSSHTAKNHSTQKPTPTKKSSKAGFPKYLVISVCIGALLLIFLAFLGFVCYKRRRNVIRVNLNDYGGAQPLLSSTSDDDTNIIM